METRIDREHYPEEMSPNLATEYVGISRVYFFALLS